MPLNFSFNRITPDESLDILKKDCLDNMLRPPDGMWESFRDTGQHWEIVNEDERIGYAILDHEDQLIQFYLKPDELSRGLEIFGSLVEELKIKKGIVGTHNPIYLSLALAQSKSVEVHSHLFENQSELAMEEKSGAFKIATPNDLDRILDFCHESTGAPKTWLRGYIENLILKGEIFFLENKEQIIGTSEVRKSKAAPDFADIGMIVSKEFRRQGYGTYLLSKAKEIAHSRGKEPICSCEKLNIASRKAIYNSGFVSRFQLLTVTFE